MYDVFGVIKVHLFHFHCFFDEQFRKNVSNITHVFARFYIYVTVLCKCGQLCHRRCTFLNAHKKPGNSIGAWQERTDTWEEDLKKLKEVMEKAQFWCELDEKGSLICWMSFLEKCRIQKQMDLRKSSWIGKWWMQCFNQKIFALYRSHLTTSFSFLSEHGLEHDQYVVSYARISRMYLRTTQVYQRIHPGKISLWYVGHQDEGDWRWYICGHQSRQEDEVFSGNKAVQMGQYVHFSLCLFMCSSARKQSFGQKTCPQKKLWMFPI